MHESASILTVLTVFTLAIISPGPNFLMVVQTALSAPRNCAFATAAGVAAGSGLFALTGMIGIMSLISALPYFTLIARITGGTYLCYLALRMLFSLRHINNTQRNSQQVHGPCPAATYFRIGLMTNLTNPKAWGFYLSLFTLVVSPSFGLIQKLVLTLAMFLISLSWYGTVALVTSGRKQESMPLKLRIVIQSTLAFLLFFFGGKLLAGILNP